MDSAVSDFKRALSKGMETFIFFSNFKPDGSNLYAAAPVVAFLSLLDKSFGLFNLRIRIVTDSSKASEGISRTIPSCFRIVLIPGIISCKNISKSSEKRGKEILNRIRIITAIFFQIFSIIKIL